MIRARWRFAALAGVLVVAGTIVAVAAQPAAEAAAPAFPRLDPAQRCKDRTASAERRRYRRMRQARFPRGPE